MKALSGWLAGCLVVGALAISPAKASASGISLYDDTGSGPLSADFVKGPSSPGKWGNPALGTGATVTWSLMPTGTSCAGEAAGCSITALSSFMPAGFLTAIQNAFAAWAAVADLNFVFVADDGSAEGGACGTCGDIRIGGHFFDGQFGVLAHGFFPPANGGTFAGDLHFDTGDVWKLGFGGNPNAFDIFQVAAHELGHALGLDHTNVPNSLMNPFYSEAFSGPQADDIAGMQFLYGKAATPPAVPEPATMLLLGSGLAIGAFRKRRQA